MENLDRDDDMNTPAFTCSESLLGFVFILLLVIVVAFIFAHLGIEPPREAGPLPWMVK